MLDFRYGVWYDEYINKLKKFGKPDVNQGRKVRSLLHLPPGQKPQKVVRLQWVLSFSRGGGYYCGFFYTDACKTDGF